MVDKLKDKFSFKVSVKAMRAEELISLVSNGDTNHKLREEASIELDNRRISLKNVHRAI